jgi:hypothetical protein
MLVAAAILSLPPKSWADAIQPHVLLDVGWNKHSSADVNGAIFGAGLALWAGPLLGTIAADVTLQDDETAAQSRYYMDTFSNGQSRCRDRETGQFAPTEKCRDLSIDAIPGATADGAFVVSRRLPVYLGGGVYVSSRATTPFLSFGYLGGVGEERVLGHARIVLGKDLIQARIGAAIPLGRSEPNALRWGHVRANVPMRDRE